MAPAQAHLPEAGVGQIEREQVFQSIQAQTARPPVAFVLQAGEWHMPRSSGDQLVPGRRAIPLDHLLRAVHATGYWGACTVGILSRDMPDSLYDTASQAVVRDSRDGLDVAVELSRSAAHGLAASPT